MMTPPPAPPDPTRYNVEVEVMLHPHESIVGTFKHPNSVYTKDANEYVVFSESGVHHYPIRSVRWFKAFHISENQAS